MRSRKHTLLIVLSSTEPNLQQFQSQRSEYNNLVANKKADMAQKQLNNMIQVQLVYSLNNSYKRLKIISKIHFIYHRMPHSVLDNHNSIVLSETMWDFNSTSIIISFFSSFWYYYNCKQPWFTWFVVVNLTILHPVMIRNWTKLHRTSF